MNLHEKTLKLIADKPPNLSLEDIRDALKDKYKIKVSYSWICKFSAGNITNPSYRTLQSLHDYLMSVSKRT